MNRHIFNFPVILLNKVAVPMHSPFQPAIDSLLMQVNHLTGRKNRSSLETQQKRLDAAQLLVEALYRCYKSAHPHAAVVVPASPRAFNYADPDRVNVVGHKIVRSLVDTMLKLNWVVETKGSRYDDTNVPTLIRPASALLAHFSAIGYVWYPKPAPPSKSLVVMKNYDPVERKGYRIPVPENDAVRRMRSALNKINNFLGKQCIALMVKNETYKSIARRLGQWRNKDGRDIPPSIIDCQSVFLRRIFSRSSMHCGGRLYGAWWQSIPKEFRVHITINGLPTSEIDYAALHPTILYHRAGIDLPDQDLYQLDLPGPKTTSSAQEHLKRRAIIKGFINAKLNDQRDEHELSKENQKVLGLSTAQLIKIIERERPLIAKHFGTSIGIELQRIDSDIAMLVVRKLLDQNIVCLPIHDSFIVPITGRNQLQQAMSDAYHEIVGHPIGLRGKSLFDNTPEGQRIIQPEFPGVFSPAGEFDDLATMQALDESWHSQFLRSQVAHYQQKGRITPRPLEEERLQGT